MGRQVKTNKQTRNAGTADYASKNFARVNRTGIFGKLFSAVKTVRGKIYNG